MCIRDRLELGFITSDTDNKSFDTHFDAYAKAIAKGVCAALGVEDVYKRQGRRLPQRQKLKHHGDPGGDAGGFDERDQWAANWKPELY